MVADCRRSMLRVMERLEILRQQCDDSTRFGSRSVGRRQRHGARLVRENQRQHANRQRRQNRFEG